MRGYRVASLVLAVACAVGALTAGEAHAQNQAAVVATCGTPNTTYKVGQTLPVTMDTKGNVCQSGSGGSAPVTTTGTLITGQVSVAVTGTPVQFPANAGLVNGVLVTACGPSSSSSPVQHANTASVIVGNATTAASNICDGAHQGDCLSAGSSHGYGVNNTNILWLNGVIGDCVTFEGN